MSPVSPILGSMRPDGSRLVLHPADVRGRWLAWRRAAFVALIAFYVAAPFIPVGGHPMIQLDVAHRSFYLFGHTFNAQDFWLVVLIALAFVFGLLLLTAWRGRVWCGWACPQTVFLEGVYRPIERWFDGPRENQLRLEKAPWTAGKLARRAGKHLAFAVVSLAIAHTAAAIFVSPRELLLMIEEGPRLHLEAFFLTIGFAAVLMFNFAWFREQFCVVLCPYGRLQSVLHDRDSITVAYDARRGEPRGRLQKSPSPGTPPRGDCVDCHRCVLVCPTGIDIRNGLQMECLACTQCIDACDEVMDKVGRPRGLIRFLSEAEQADGRRRVLRPRLAVYGLLFLLSVSALGASLLARRPFEANLLRPKGSLPFQIDGEVVRNVFEIHLVNKNPGPARFSISIAFDAELPGEAMVARSDVELESLADQRVPVSIAFPRRLLRQRAQASPGAPIEWILRVEDHASGERLERRQRFLAPGGSGPG